MSAVADLLAIEDAQVKQPAALILGLGNILVEDEGVGIACIEYLQQNYQFPDEVELLDGGTSGMALLDDLRHRKKLIVIDAVRTGNPPGTRVILKGDEVPAFFRNKISPHQLALSDVLAVLTLSGDKTEDISVIGVEPVSLKTRIGLSERVTAQIEPLAHHIIDELNHAGFKVKKLAHQIHCDSHSYPTFRETSNHES